MSDLNRQTLYLQRWHGYWRVRKPVPKLLIPIIGKGQYLTRSLRTANFNEAKRLAPAVLAEFNNIIEQARLRFERAACRDATLRELAHLDTLNHDQLLRQSPSVLDNLFQRFDLDPRRAPRTGRKSYRFPRSSRSGRKSGRSAGAPAMRATCAISGRSHGDHHWVKHIYRIKSRRYRPGERGREQMGETGSSELVRPTLIAAAPPSAARRRRGIVLDRYFTRVAILPTFVVMLGVFGMPLAVLALSQFHRLGAEPGPVQRRLCRAGELSGPAERSGLHSAASASPSSTRRPRWQRKWYSALVSRCC